MKIVAVVVALVVVSVVTICGVVLGAFFYCGFNQLKSEAQIRQPWAEKADADDRDYNQFVKPILSDVFDGNYKQLEERASQLKQEDTYFKSGISHIDIFYQAVGDYDEWNQSDPGQYYPQLEQRMLEWHAKYPESPVANVALIKFYIGYGWFARSGKWAHEVKEQQWKIFHERLNKAYQLLGNAPESVWEEASFYPAVAVLMGALQNDEDYAPTMNQMIARMQNHHPDYSRGYDKVCVFLLPRWHGISDTHWHEWLVAALESETIDSEKIDEIYASVVLRRISYAYGDQDEPNPFTASNVDWERLQKGYQKLRARYPESTTLPGRYFKAAFRKGDVAAMAEVLTDMNFEYDSYFWKGRKDSEFFNKLALLVDQHPELKSVILK